MLRAYTAKHPESLSYQTSQYGGDCRTGRPIYGCLSTRQSEFCSHLAKLDTYNTADIKFPHVSVLTVKYADVLDRPASGDRAMLVFRVGGRNTSGFAYKFTTQLVQARMTRFISPS
jgi:hypothetical protein